VFGGGSGGGKGGTMQGDAAKEGELDWLYNSAKVIFIIQDPPQV